MYTPDPKWAKWIKVSTIKHFAAMATTNNIHFYIAGTDNNNAVYDRFIEFRMDGPIVTQLSRNYFRLLIGINVLYSTDVETNYLDDVILAGLILESFSDICVYKYGDGDAYLGSMIPSEITTNSFGTVKDTKIKQGSVESIFTIFLEN